MEYLTVYAFSTENWKRPADEVNTIMGLLEQYLLRGHRHHGEGSHPAALLRGHDAHCRRSCRRWRTGRTISPAHYDGFQANICLNYGGRDEMLRAAGRFAADCAAGKRRPEELDGGDVSPPTCTPPVSPTRS